MNKEIIAAVVVTYNRKILLKECLESLLMQTHPLDSIILVDNASTDGTRDYLKANGILQKKEISYIRLEKNSGGAGGFYEGIKFCYENGYDWLWLMDDDTIPAKDALEKLLDSRKYLNHEKVGFLCSNVKNQSLLPMNIPEVTNKNSANGYYRWPQYLEYGLVEVDSATFVSVLIPKETINKVGYPCKEFFIWGDDVEYTLRITKYYGNSYIVGNSIVIHKRESGALLSIVNETNINRIKMFYYSYRNNLIVNEHYRSKRACMGFKLGIFKTIFKIIFSNNKNKLIRIWTILRAIIDFRFNRSFRRTFKKRFGNFA